MAIRSKDVIATGSMAELQFTLKIPFLINVLSALISLQSTLEVLCIEVKPVRSPPFVVLAWYRSPNEAVDNFHLINTQNNFEKSLSKQNIPIATMSIFLMQQFQGSEIIQIITRLNCCVIAVVI